MHGSVDLDTPRGGSLDDGDVSSGRRGPDGGERGGEGRASAARRRIRPRRIWPGSRAVVGGLLVAVSAVGLYAAYQGAEPGPSAQFVVVREPIAPGTVITAAHVGLVDADLPPGIAANAFAASDDAIVLGSVAVQALDGGQLLQRSDIRDADEVASNAVSEVSFEIETARALNGRLQPGERIDVVATFGSGPTARTDEVLDDVLVVGVDRDANSSLATDEVVITVALEQASDAVALAAAIDRGRVTIVRSVR